MSAETYPAPEPPTQPVLTWLPAHVTREAAVPYHTVIPCARCGKKFAYLQGYWHHACV